MEIILGGVTSPKGFYGAGVHCGLKKDLNKKDLALIYSHTICNAAGVYTLNQVKGEPLFVTMEHLKDGKAQAIIVNSGNANTCTGEDGLKKAYKMAELVSKELKIKKSDVVVASTGIIGVPLKIDLIEKSIGKLVESLSNEESDCESACQAIMTTDTLTKSIAVCIQIGEINVNIGGIAKGSGMIHPNMATMLSFITTDVNINQDLLESALSESVKKTYNRISVDGDTSTNDMVVILANSNANNLLIYEKDINYQKFLDALNYVNTYLAKLIAKDGEGATKLIECKVKGAGCEDDGVKLAKSVIMSSLVKTACFGADANWGRILCALGYSGVTIDVKKIDVIFESSKGSIQVCKGGISLPFDEEKAKLILNESEIKIIIDINSDDESRNINEPVSAWGCDLSYDYVKINGDYRS